MRIGVPKETQPGETRVAMIPGLVGFYTREGHEIIIEAGAGQAARFSDELYAQAGATIAGSAAEIYRQAEVIMKVQPPGRDPVTGKPEATFLPDSSTYIGFLSPFTRPDLLEMLNEKNITGFAMEFIPRLTRTQNMDALSSMATLAGYKAVLLAADRLTSLFPLMVTAAGTIYPAKVLVLGAGVSGLQAIATAHRLGARVEAFDPRPAVEEQVKSLGASFVKMELPAETTETAGGYARAQSDEFLLAERTAIAAHLSKTNVVICTAQVFGKPAPRLITREMLDMLPPGALVIDLAVEQGGNCELAEPGKWIDYKNVSILGSENLPALLPTDASQLYAHNLYNFFHHIYPPATKALNISDEITWSSCVTLNGKVVNELLK